MKKVILILIMTFFQSCEESVLKAVKLKEDESKSTLVLKPYLNPANIYGSNFGSFFQGLYRLNKFDLMMNFTSNKSKEQFGIDVIRNYYEDKFRFDFNLGRLSNIIEIKDIIYLTYVNASIYGTRRKVVVCVMIENDTSKLLLTNLNNCPF
jgi:hypothetical protein